MFAIYGGLFLLLFWRIVHIQATGEVEGHALAVEAAAKYEKETVLAADRGKILDRDGNIIAEDTLSYRLIAVVRESATTNPEKPRHVVDPQETAKILAQYIPMDEAEIYARLTKEGDPYQVEFKSAGRGISHEVKTEIDELKLPGILFVSDTKRYYPNGSFAAHLIGFALKEDQKDGTTKTVGKMGLESIYNDQLTGTDGALKYQSDAFRYLLPNSEKMVQPATDGSDIHLTLDKSIQNFLEDAMSRVNDEYNPESMVGVVANPKTGEILAISQRPTFDPDTRAGLETNWLNDVIENVIEPGSTMKIFTVGAAVDSGNWHPNATYQSGQYTLLDRTIRDHNLVGWGTISYLEGFQRSSNTAMAHLLEIMGRDTFVEYINKFGFGEKTGIDLPREATGTILTKVPSNVLTTSYGQGSTVTPIQLIQGLTAIANDGEMMQPYVIDKIVDPNTGEVTFDSKPTVKSKPISAETAKTMRELLASTVTSEVGTAKRFQIEGYEVAGKTGTAQMPKKNGVGYDWGKNEFLYSFLGMAPADDPQLIMYIAIAKPQLSATEVGSEPVSQVFNSVMQNSLKYLNINPEDVAKVKVTSVADYVGQQAEAIQIELMNEGLQPIIIGKGGEVIAQYPKAETKATAGSLVFLKTDGEITLPSFTEWSLRNLLVYKTMSKLPIEIIGEGYVESQSASPNTVILDNAPIVVKLKTPEQSFATPVEEIGDEGEQLPQD
ncbi:penicillin-binding transpeptidase domain-containing protein [Solibacillus sp. FSL H8-0538]|uniref:penicillin-binding transpeptidase domain-containing protein n=1 Tax=Solibacillus sp. FSL H8-0538 TaxID=2921400 RepID=UPI0030FA6D81